MLTPHILSKEQQTLFEKTTGQHSSPPPPLSTTAPLPTLLSLLLPSPFPPGVHLSCSAAIKGNDRVLSEAALSSVVQGVGLQQLLPYFVHFISDEVSHSLRHLPSLHSALQLAAALLTSKALYIEPYLHQLLPSLLTCLLGRHLCADPSEDHWTLRHQAATLITLICRRFGVTYAALQPRVTRTMVGALLDVQRPLTTHYGAIIGIARSARTASMVCGRGGAAVGC